MNEEVRSLLELEGCDVPSEEPPIDFLVADNPLIHEATFSPVDTSALYQISGADSINKKPEDRYWAARQFYVHQLTAVKRNTLIEQGLQQIKETLTSGNIDDIKNILKQRHKWVSEAHKYRNDTRQICYEENCAHFALPGSKYCINHITLDKQQKLYVKCPSCGTVHPVFCPCSFCNHEL